MMHHYRYMHILKSKQFVELLLCPIIILLAASAVFGAGGKICVLPEPDGGGPAPSKPQVTGDITQVTPGLIRVQTTLQAGGQDHNEQIDIGIDENTHLFTVYGGYVSKAQLAVGQHVYIWFSGCSIKKAGSPPRAAVIELKSK